MKPVNPQICRKCVKEGGRNTDSELHSEINLRALDKTGLMTGSLHHDRSPHVTLCNEMFKNRFSSH